MIDGKTGVKENMRGLRTVVEEMILMANIR